MTTKKQTRGYSVKALLLIAERYGYYLECVTISSVTPCQYYICARQGIFSSPYPRRLYSRNFGEKFRNKLEAEGII